MQLCSQCHVIGRGTREGEFPSPAFLRGANMPSTAGPALAVILQSHHERMPSLRLDRDEMNAVIDYILSFKGARAARPRGRTSLIGMAAMNEMTIRHTDTLPALQASLDGLGTGQGLRLANADCDRLVGVNDALMGRVRNFAQGHNCILLWDDEGLTFCRQPHAAGRTTALPTDEPRT